MKKNRLFLAGMVLALSFGAVTGCGNTRVDDTDNNRNQVNTESNINDNRIDRATEMEEPDNLADTESRPDGGNVVDDVVDGVGDAGKDVIDGVENGVDDLTDDAAGENGATTGTANP